MLIDNPQLMDRSNIGRTAAANGSNFPSSPQDQDIFEIVNGVGITDGVYIYSARISEWVLAENNYDGVYDIGLTIFDRPRSLDIVCKHIAARTFVIDAGFEGSIANANFAATDVTVFQVQLIVAGAPVNVGTLTFGANSDTGVFATFDNNSIVVKRGQLFRILSPEIRDATLSSIDVTISGKLLVPR